MNRNKNFFTSNKSSANSLPFIEIIINKFAFLIFIVLSLIIGFVVFKDFFLDKYFFYFKDIGSDSVNIAFPSLLQSYHLQQTGEGYFRFWSFYKGLGQAYSNPITLNPLVYISMIFSSIFGLTFWLNRIYPYFFYYILGAGIFAFFYFRTLNISKFVSIIGALLFEFSGYMIVGAQWAHLVEPFLFIFFIFSFEQFLIKKRWFYIPIVAYFISYNMFVLASSSIFLLLYSLVRYYDFHDSLKGYILFMFKFAALGLLGVLMNAPKMIFNFLKMYESPRIVGDVTQAHLLLTKPENISTYLRNVTTILRFYGNDLLGAGSKFKGWYNYLEAPLFYIGNLTLILFTFAFSFIEKKKRYIYAGFLLFWLLVAFVPELRHAINFYVGNYYKIGVDIFVPFTLLFFSIFALDKIIKEQKINTLLLVSVLGFLLILLHFPYFKFNNAIVNEKMKIIISVFILIYGLLIYLLTTAKNKSFVKLVLLLLVCSELSYVAWYSSNKRDIYTAKELKNNLAGYKDGTMVALDSIRAHDSSLFFRVEKDYSSGNSQNTSLNDAQAQGYFGTPTYGSFNQINYIRFLEEMQVIKKGNEGQTRWCTGVRGIPILMTFVDVKYFLTHNLKNKLRFNDYDSIGFVRNILILKNKHALPLGFTYDNFLTYNIFKELSKFKKQELLLNAVILGYDNKKINTHDLAKFDTSKLISLNEFSLKEYIKMTDSLRKDTLTIISFKNKNIQGKINLKKAKILFFTIPYDKGWKIYVNGKRRELKRLNIGFMGIYLDKGNYNIKLVYKPPYFWLSLSVAIFSVFIFVFLLFYLKKEKSNKFE